VSKHIFAKPTTNNLKLVDAPGLDRREKLLPGEVSPSTCGKGEKSAEAIVGIGNEPRTETVEDSQDSEGLNDTLLEIR
jgi:hypothetical protein